MEFRWNAANTEHIALHGISPEEAEYVVKRAKRPYPEKHEDEKFYVAGKTETGHYIQIVFIVDPPPLIYVIHARPLTKREKKIYRRRSR
jgi:uncharacterized DUF497 family protein